jgi:hypothetical protein
LHGTAFHQHDDHVLTPPRLAAANPLPTALVHRWARFMERSAPPKN